MTLKLTVEKSAYTDFTPRITVIGVGGAGTNAVDNMIELDLQGVDFLVANTDAQQLTHSQAGTRIQLGPHLTQGLGAGAKPEIGEAAAEEAADEIYRHLENILMVFITAGMGGGTGTGAAPVIARMAREKGILTVGVVTKPFEFEGRRRAEAADRGIRELQQHVDTLIIIPNQNLFRMANERTTWKDAFKMADNVLYMGVRGITDLMMTRGLINLDFADVRTVMVQKGTAMMGTGEAEGEDRALRAAEAAISNPLLEATSMQGARGLLINISGGEDLTLLEVDQAANRIRREVDEDADILFGSAIDPALEGRIRVSIVATGLDKALAEGQQTSPFTVLAGGRAAPTAMPAAPRREPAPQEIQAPEAQLLDMAQPESSPAAEFLAPELEMEAETPAAEPPPQVRPAARAQNAPRAPASGARAAAQRAAPPAEDGLFASEQREEPAAPQPARGTDSLFKRMTGLWGGGRSAAPPPPRAQTPAPRGRASQAPPEPDLSEARAEPRAEPRATIRPATTTEETFEIPTFLRRQGSVGGA